MKNTKALFLFLALILPVCIFLFLKFFGKNEFEVKPLFLDSAPPVVTGCPAVAVPYVVDDSIRTQLTFGSDSLLIILFSYETQPITNQVRRIEDEVENLPVRPLTLSESDRHLFWKQCVFCLKEN